MKARNLKEYKSGWVQTVMAVVGSLFAVAVLFGWVTPQQSADALPLIGSVLTAVSAFIAGAIALFGLFFKNE